MRDHIKDPNVQRYRVNYKGQGPGTAFVDLSSNNMVLLRSNGEFWSAWKLGSNQLNNVIRKGWLW